MQTAYGPGGTRVNALAPWPREYGPKAGPVALTAAIVERARHDLGSDRPPIPSECPVADHPGLPPGELDSHDASCCARPFLERVRAFAQRHPDPVEVSLYILSGVIG